MKSPAEPVLKLYKLEDAENLSPGAVRQPVSAASES